MDLNFPQFLSLPAQCYKASSEGTTVHVIVHTWTSAIQVLLAASVQDCHLCRKPIKNKTSKKIPL